MVRALREMKGGERNEENGVMENRRKERRGEERKVMKRRERGKKVMKRKRKASDGDNWKEKERREESDRTSGKKQYNDYQWNGYYGTPYLPIYLLIIRSMRIFLFYFPPSHSFPYSCSFSKVILLYDWHNPPSLPPSLYLYPECGVAKNSLNKLPRHPKERA